MSISQEMVVTHSNYIKIYLVRYLDLKSMSFSLAASFTARV